MKGPLQLLPALALGAGIIASYVALQARAQATEAKAEQNRVAIEEIKADQAQIKTDVAVIRTNLEHLTEAQQKGGERIEAALGRLLERGR